MKQAAAVKILLLTLVFYSLHFRFSLAYDAMQTTRTAIRKLYSCLFSIDESQIPNYLASFTTLLQRLLPVVLPKRPPNAATPQALPPHERNEKRRKCWSLQSSKQPWTSCRRNGQVVVTKACQTSSLALIRAVGDCGTPSALKKPDTPANVDMLPLRIGDAQSAESVLVAGS